MASPALRRVALAVKGVGSQGDGTVQVPHARRCRPRVHFRRVFMSLPFLGPPAVCVSLSLQVLCRGPEEQKQALHILTHDLKCDGFLLTVPAALPAPERPLLHPHRVRCALVVVDPKASQVGTLLDAFTNQGRISYSPVRWQ